MRGIMKKIILIICMLILPCIVSAYENDYFTIDVKGDFKEMIEEMNSSVAKIKRAANEAKEVISERIDILKEEAEKLRRKYNESLPAYEAIYKEQPEGHFAYINRKYANVAPEMDKIIIQFIVVIALMLVVPAINLSSMTGSRMRKRMSELGVRRAFGATKGYLMLQVLWESMLQTLLGGIVGLVFSIVAAFAFKGVIYSNSAMASQMGDTKIDFGALLTPIIFLYAFLFCILLNLLSAIIPAWRTSRKPIVDSILSK